MPRRESPCRNSRLSARNRSRLPNMASSGPFSSGCDKRGFPVIFRDLNPWLTLFGQSPTAPPHQVRPWRRFGLLLAFLSIKRGRYPLHEGGFHEPDVSSRPGIDAVGRRGTPGSTRLPRLHPRRRRGPSLRSRDRLPRIRYRYDSGQGVCVTAQDITLISMRHWARRGPSAVLRQIRSPAANVRPWARQ